MEEKEIQNEVEIKKENVVKGIIGGLIGSLAGVLAIVLFSKLGYIASVAGLIMAVCTIKLYEKFAGSIGKKGIISCIVIMIIMTLVAENTAFTLQILKELKAEGVEGEFSYIFINLYKFMSLGYLNTSGYITDLIMIFAFNLLGSFGIFKNKFNELQNKKTS